MKTGTWIGILTVMAAFFASARPALTQQVLISGSVRTAAGVPVPGVTMSGLPGGPTTDSNGSYASKVSVGWSGTVMPAHPCYTISPASTSYAQVAVSQSTSYVATASATTISGYVRTPGGAAIPGVVISGLAGTATTDSGGFYSATVSCGWSGTLTPSLAGFTFFPALLSYSNISGNQKNQNYTGTGPGQVTVSGYVTTLDGKPLPGVTINGLPGAPYTDASGFYSAKVSTDWSGMATPSLMGYTFNPSALTFMHVSADMPNQDFVGRAAQ